MNTSIKVPFNMDIPSDILKISKIFKKQNYNLMIVGGAVRDALLNKVPKDFDLVTDAIPDVVENIMQSAGFKTLPTGKAFGVINVFTNEGEYEIATARIDSKTSDGMDELTNFISFLKNKVTDERLEEFKNKIMK